MLVLDMMLTIRFLDVDFDVQSFVDRPSR